MRSLIEDLSRDVQVEYISDMHLAEYRLEVLHIVKGFPENAYPEEEWKEAYTYLTGDRSLTILLEQEYEGKTWKQRLISKLEN